MTVTNLGVVERSRSERAPLLAASMAVLCWGVGPLAVHEIVAPVSVIAFYRMWVAVPIMWAAARLGGNQVTWAIVRRAAPAGVLFAASLITGWAALQQTSIANSSFISALQPVLVLLVAGRLFGERVTRDDLLLSGVAFAGITLFVFAAGATSGASFHGDLWAVGNLLIWAVYFLVVKRIRDDGVPAMPFLTGVMVTGAVALTPYVFLTGGDLHSIGGWEWGLVLFVAVVPGLVGHGLMTWAQRFAEVSILSVITLGSPVISAIAAWPLFGQALAPAQIVAGGVVLVATGVLVVRHQGRGVASE